MEKIICEICGNQFEVKRYRKGKARFCSSACYGKHQQTSRLGKGRVRVIVQCYTCGSDIEKHPSAVSDHNFCNRQCWQTWRASSDWSGENNPAWLGGHIGYRGKNWKKQRKSALKRDDNTCQHCGKFGITLHVHHIKPYHLFDHYKEANNINNLISLCQSCHSSADNLFWEKYPDLVNSRRVPNCVSIINCQKCNNPFLPRSASAKFCDKCCTFTCANCGEDFYSRKVSDRTPKYCSKDCRNEYIKNHKIPRRKSSPVT